MVSDKFSILLRKLLSKTREKGISWHETADESAFRIALGDGLIRIEYSGVYESGEYYAAYLQNRKGRTLDQIGPLYQEEDLMRQLLSELFEAARSSALGVDDILERMVKDAELGITQDPPPEEKEDLPF
ncbi:MAG: hypothetical protein F4Z57_22890 [Gemmatimonadetes bacterium]|nr:hypothetical protein [Gemmatimonadota bacterium]MYC70020.1 hypothetical protein [Gemmatimonadota bacterium]MYI60890.1 hypothetical protein [Gemmatimonadota bacterium]